MRTEEDANQSDRVGLNGSLRSQARPNNLLMGKMVPKKK